MVCHERLRHIDETSTIALSYDHIGHVRDKGLRNHWISHLLCYSTRVHHIIEHFLLLLLKHLRHDLFAIFPHCLLVQ